MAIFMGNNSLELIARESIETSSADCDNGGIKTVASRKCVNPLLFL
jgi:hypothetical protein